MLVLGPDTSGNILEVVGEFDAEDVFSSFHALPARTGYLRLLKGEEQR